MFGLDSGKVSGPTAFTEEPLLCEILRSLRRHFALNFALWWWCWWACVGGRGTPRPNPTAPRNVPFFTDSI